MLAPRPRKVAAMPGNSHESRLSQPSTTQWDHGKWLDAFDSGCVIRHEWFASKYAQHDFLYEDRFVHHHLWFMLLGLKADLVLLPHNQSRSLYLEGMREHDNGSLFPELVYT